MVPFDDVIMVEFRAWISYYIPPFNINVVTSPCPNPDAGLANLFKRKTSNINRTLVGNKIVDNSDIVGASPVGAAPTSSSFST